MSAKGIPDASVMDARRGSEDYWFVFNTEQGLEAIIPFDTVRFDVRDNQSIRKIEFYRRLRMRKAKTGQVEGGRADWGDVINELEDYR